jgi:hypothetical protein
VCICGYLHSTFNHSNKFFAAEWRPHIFRFPQHSALNFQKTCYTATHGVTLFDEELFPGDKAAAIKACSDHLPVCRVVTGPS